ncbi:MAG: ankyrin repeat domain-containing protein [Acidiferrobacterales bacterium]
MKIATRLLLLFLSWMPVSLAWAALDDDWRFAIARRDFATIEHLIPQVNDVNLPARDGRTALMLAASHNRIDLMRKLLGAGARVNIENQRGGTALMYAAVTGDPAPMRLLLSHGAAVNATSDTGWGALMIVSAKGYIEIVQLLIAHGAEVNVRDIYGWTPLMKAAFEGRFAVVRLLLDQESVDLHAVDENGATALHHAAAVGHVKIARLLIAYGADIERKDGAGQTPLMIAAKQGRAEMIDLINQSLDKQALQ